MTVSELIEKLGEFPPDLVVLLADWQEVDPDLGELRELRNGWRLLPGSDSIRQSILILDV